MTIIKSILTWGSCLVVGCGIGVAAHRYLQAPLEDVVFDAVSAWNNGEIEKAEKLARHALGRSADAFVARDLLIQISAYKADPLLHVAALRSTPGRSVESVDSIFKAGEVAWNAGYGRIAEESWRDAILIQKDFSPAYDRLIMLAAIRLESSVIKDILLDRNSHLPSNLESIRLLLGSESITSEAAAMQPVLENLIKNDPLDARSRLGLARCLQAASDFQGAISVLEHDHQSNAELVYKSFLEVLRGGPDVEISSLPKNIPNAVLAEFFFCKANDFEESGKISESVEFFAKAAMTRPLSRTFRAKYCEALRLAGMDEQNRLESIKLKTIQSIEQTTKNPSTIWNNETISKLSEQCRAVDADKIAELLENHLLRSNE